MPKKKQEQDYAKELQKSHESWTHLYEHGCNDPCWEDGINLNLVRNHINYYRGKIEETMLPEDYPAVYFSKIPPKVDSKYMACKDEIRAAAKRSLLAYKTDPDYQYILHHQNDFSHKTKKNLHIDAVIGYATKLETAIKQDDLIYMRRHKNADSYLESFKNCTCRMKDTPGENVQLDLFSISANGRDEPENDIIDEREGEELGSMTMQ